MSITKFRPSNAIAGDAFIARWCGQCAHDKVINGEIELDCAGPDDYCQILLDTHMFAIDEPGYPIQWQIQPSGEPCCTAFVPFGTVLPLATVEELEAAGQLRLEIPEVRE